MTNKLKCFQDGGRFYVDTLAHPDYDGFQPIADYGLLVANDGDTHGAGLARLKFLQEFSEYCALG
jgi:hypothetical protein